MRVFEALAAALADAGAPAAFTLMSEDVARLCVELERRGVPVRGTRHESAAIGMAHGHARGSGKVGVAIVGRGPGFTNALTLLLNAAKDGPGTGLLVIAGDTARKDATATPAGAGQVKYIDQTAVLDALGVPNVLLGSAESAAADFRVAYAHARAGGTVVVGLPIDVGMAEAGDAPARAALEPLPAPGAPDPDEIAAVADLLEESWAAKRPLILAGRGAVLAGAGPELRRLGEAVGALLGTSLLARSLFRGDPWDLGVIGTVARPAALELAPEADLVLVFGASIQPTTTWRGETFRTARIVHVDPDPRAFGRSHRADLTIRADARLAAAALADELARRGHRATGWRTADGAARLTALRAAAPPAPKERPGALHPRIAMRALEAILPRNRALVVETGMCLSFTAGELTVDDPGSFYFPHGFGTIGASLGFALGLALARPDRLTVYAGGDGSFMMTVADLDTAVRYRVPVVFIVCNDGGFGAEVHMLRVNELDGDAARYRNPSLAGVARALGADGVTVRTLADIEALRPRLASLDGPLVVDCIVDGEVQASWVEFFFKERAAAH